jgi:hypothetical protein
MNYQELRDLWHEALKAARLLIPYPIGPAEQINLRELMNLDLEPLIRASQKTRLVLAEVAY